jgi:ribonuclease P/MRP protein subunit POP7
MAETDPQLSDSSNQPLPEPKANKRVSKGKRATSSKNSSSLLVDIKFERKNKPQLRLPPHHSIQTRPIIHPPVAAPYAGPAIQKVVYVSKHTPIMAAVKRVKKLLEQVEKRKLQSESDLETGKRAGNMVAPPQNRNQTEQEVVLVKASGRAIEQAARVGEWFKRHSEDGDGGWIVDVRPLNVKVIDDIVEDSSTPVDNLQARPKQVNDSRRQEESSLDCSASEKVDKLEDDGVDQAGNPDAPSQSDKGDNEASQVAAIAPTQKQSHKKRKRPMYDAEDVPEARTRFINAVEIAVSLKY